MSHDSCCKTAAKIYVATHVNEIFRQQTYLSVVLTGQINQYIFNSSNTDNSSSTDPAGGAAISTPCHKSFISASPTSSHALETLKLNIQQ